VSNHGVTCRSGIIVVARVAGGFFSRGMVVAKVGRAHAPCLLGERRSILPSPSEAVGTPVATHKTLISYTNMSSKYIK
jgi:hypothetical protein